MFSQRADRYDRNETIRKTREIPQQGQKGIPQKKARRRNPRANQINWADSAKAQGPGNGGRTEPEKLTQVPARARGAPQKPHDPPATVARQISRRGTTKQGVRKTKKGVAIQIWSARKKVRRGFSGPFQKDNSLRKRSIPLHDAAVQERLGIRGIGVNHTEPCLTLGGPPNLNAQTNARKNR